MMKIIDITIKDMTRSMRSAISLLFMFGLPLMVSGMYYVMFGDIARKGSFDLPHTTVVIANLDEGGPNLHLNGKNVPGNLRADTLGELVVKILQSEDLADLVDATLLPDATAARKAVDNRQFQVAVIIPADFSRQFADPDEQAIIEFYQDPTLTIGPGIVKSIMNQFTDGLAGINITADIALDQADIIGGEKVSTIIQQYLQSYLHEDNSDISASMLKVSAPNKEAQKENNFVMNILGPIMGGMMIFFAFYTGTASAESILTEEEEHTLQRLFTTPTPQTVILSGKFLAVFLTVMMQVIVLLTLGRLIFRVDWGAFSQVALTAVGIIFSASSFGIFINSLLKNTKQGGIIFGGVLTFTGMLGMIQIFTMNSASSGSLAKIVSLLAPQGWAVNGLLQAINKAPLIDSALTTLVLLIWSIAFFAIGVWRFNRRYT
jgi:ABC-2 type transport system permease protein